MLGRSELVVKSAVLLPSDIAKKPKDELDCRESSSSVRISYCDKMRLNRFVGGAGMSFDLSLSKRALLPETDKPSFVATSANICESTILCSFFVNLPPPV